MPQYGVNYPNQILENAPVIYQNTVTIGNAGGTLNVQSGAPTTFNGAATIAGQNVAYIMSPVGPGDIGMKAWSFPNYLALGTASAVTVTGSVYLAALHLTAGVSYGTLYIKVQANGGTATVGSNWAGLYSPTGALVAQTGDISTILGTAAGNTGYMTMPLSATYTPAVSGEYWVGLQFAASAAGSFPAFFTMSNFITVTTSAGDGATGIAAPNGVQPFPYSAVATTGTVLPSSFALGSAGTTGAYVFWAGAS